jgi:hypothetical protein
MLMEWAAFYTLCEEEEKGLVLKAQAESALASRRSARKR